VRKKLRILILPFCLLLVSCNRHHPPPIQNVEILRKDCAVLFQQFPVDETPTNTADYDYQHGFGIRKIPKQKWPDSVLALHPYLVCSYQGGIQIWIDWSIRFEEEGKFWNGYYVVVDSAIPPPPQAVSNHFVFRNTGKDGILLLKQIKFEIPKLR